MFLNLQVCYSGSEPTFPGSGNTLDLILTSEHDRIGSVAVEPPPPMPARDHGPIIFDYIFSGKEAETGSRQEKFSWHRGNYNRLNDELCDIDWDF